MSSQSFTLSPSREASWPVVTLLITLAVLSLSACGDDGLDPKSVLKDYRVITIRAEPPAITLSDSVEVELYDFHPQDLKADARPKITYSWTLCPFSLGSVGRYECLVDEISIDEFVQGPPMEMIPEDQEPEDEDPDEDPDEIDLVRPSASQRLIFSAPELLALLSESVAEQMELLAMGSEMLGAEMSFFDAGQVELYLKLEVTVEGEPTFYGVKTLPVLLDDELSPNVNPELTALVNVDDVDLTALSAEDEVKVEAAFEVSSAEEYTPPKSADEERQSQEPETTEETLLFSWYTTSGTFDKPVRLADDTSATLTVGEEVGPQRLYLTLRDGRGGVDLRMVEFEVTE